MSATTSFPPNPEPPPLLFGSPPFSPRSPLHTQTPASPPPVAMDEPEDVDMTTSIILPAQNHDRQDYIMEEDGGGGTADGGEEVEPSNTGDSAPDRSDEASGDAMDTTPDASPQPEPTSELQPQTTSPHLPQHSLAPSPNTSVDNSTDATGERQSRDTPPPAVSQNDANSLPPPPPAQSQSPADLASATMPPQHSSSDDDSSSVSSEEDVLQWHEVIDDTSAPDEDELKEIEASNEHVATNDEYWKRRSRVPLSDPEHQPGEEGTITWIIEKLNGTREQPNTELLMYSEPIKIGNYQFRLKFYPDSVDESRYFSMFLTCDNMSNPKDKKDDRPSSISRTKGKKKKKGKPNPIQSQPPNDEPKIEPSTEAIPEDDGEQEWQHTPIPLLEPKRIPKRKSVAAQFMIIMYNPDEPRSHFHMTFSHRFCPGNSDHGTMHFGFSKSDAAIRRRHQRQPIYRNDKLAFKCHVRLINDQTGCLWERSTRDNPYDSLLITGLQGISSAAFGISGGNVISAISTWMHLMPFRELLYQAQVPHPIENARQKPKPMLLALQKILYCLRTRPEGVSNGPFALEDLVEAFEWYALDKTTDKYDTIELWEIIRSKLEEELADTPWAGALDRIFGFRRDRAVGAPKFKVPVQGMETMQKALDSVDSFAASSPTQSQSQSFVQPLPQVLTVELERYAFNAEKRTWQKLSDKLSLDKTVVIRGQEYVLHSFIVHKENAQSGSYYSVLRPDGPSGQWYMYTDSRDENKVMCLTRKQAVAAHEGTNKKPNNDMASVAYAVTYLRGDIAPQAFDNSNEPSWDVPAWMVEEVKRDRMNDLTRNFSFPPIDAAITPNDAVQPDAAKEKGKEPVKEYDFEIIRSEAFMHHKGPGIIDLYEANYRLPNVIVDVKLSGDADATKAREQIAQQVGGISDSRQCKFWIVGSFEGTLWRPSLITTGKKEISGGGIDFDLDWTVDELVRRCPERRLWLHVIDEKDLPPLPEPVKEVIEPVLNQPVENNAAASSSNNVDNSGSAADSAPPPTADISTDSQMGGTQEPPANITAPPATEPSPLILSGDVVMEGDISALPPVSNLLMTEARALDALLTPTLPPISQFVGGPPPPAATSWDRREADHIYFFLKKCEYGQITEPLGSYFGSRHERIEKAIYKILGTDKTKTPLSFFEEDDISIIRPLTSRNSFAKEDLMNGCIILIQPPVEEDKKAELMKAGVCTDLIDHYRILNDERTFPHTSSGTYKLDYFSAESYEGEVLHHMPHGQGKKIYHNNNVYTGQFWFGKRHGQGTMTFANGNTYEGEWVEDLEEGLGTSIEHDTGNKYIGNWKGGKKHGEGITYWKVAQEEERCCRICWEGEADAVLVECGHVVACMGCARQVKDCPICRRAVSKAIKIYLVG